MDKSYDPASLEQSLYAEWEQMGCFTPAGKGDPYCIMIPPPNVTGTLHMGHAFQDTIMDTLIRYHRMCGRDTLWQAGTDHAGIATQMVVERQLNARGVTRRELGRDAFLQHVWEWKAQSGGTITNQLRRLGASLDWETERFTMDEGLSDAVREVFVRLFEEDLIYRGKRLVNWDPVLHTAVSDLEVLAEEEDGHLWHFRYPLVGGGHDGKPEWLVVATTRPETMLGDTAVAVHPDDDRFTHLIGAEVALPLTDRVIPIIGDDYVDPEFGSGCVKITPAHDFNDYEIGRRHGLEEINILTPDARINDAAPEPFRGMDRFEARKAIVAAFDALGLLDRIDPHRLVVPRGDRSGSVIEPYMTDQWYVRAGPLAEPAIRAVEKGEIRFVPENWSRTYFEWMNNIQDWCISRQLWWGHRIPAWYDDQGNIYVARDETAVRRKYGLGADVSLRQDEDVLDTWFSSALWPFSTLGWPEQTDRLERFYPTSVLVTGFDIIFFWVARMIMMGLKFTDEVPFRDVYIHGLIRDEHGHKMSKAKGNVLDPLDLVDGIDLESLVAKRTASMMQPHLRNAVEKATRETYADGIPAYGTDALRFTFLALATGGRDIRFDLGRIDGYRNFCNKLWNAARYVLMNCEDCMPAAADPMHPGLAERWIRSRLHATIESVHTHLNEYRFDLAARAAYEFAWHEYCDWYLELSKPVLQADAADPATQAATRRTLIDVLEALLRLLHPMMPFISDAIWRRVATTAKIDGETVMLQGYPRGENFAADATAEQEMQWLQGFILGVRQIRGEMNIAPSHPLPVLLENASRLDLDLAHRHADVLLPLARLASIDPAPESPPPHATALLGGMRILVPLAGLIDKAAEQERLGKQLDRAEKDLDRATAKLRNPKFVANAPADIVAKEQGRVSTLTETVRQLKEQIERLSHL